MSPSKSLGVVDVSVAVDFRRPIVRFTVPGVPVSQGSMWSPRGSSAVLHSKRQPKTGPPLRTVKQYREAIRELAQYTRRGPLVDSAVEVEVIFYLERPKSVTRRYPSVKPDLDKLQRAVGDALERGVLTEDSRIVDWIARKRYADDLGDGAEPCTVVTVREMV